MSENMLNFIPAGKIKCIITGKLRTDTPEEHVRQRIARGLLYDYGYKKEDIEIEFPIKIGTSSKRLDIAIFSQKVQHKQETIRIIIECKKEEIRPTDKENGIDQLKSYLAACINTKFGMWVGSELQTWEKCIKESGIIDFLESTDIPKYGADTPEPIKFSELIPADEELISVFKRCHNYIHGNDGFAKEAAFMELLKLIFCKVYDEKQTQTGYMRFYINNNDRRSETGKRKLKDAMDKLFDDVKRQYSYIFSSNDQIKLNPSVLAYLVSELQKYSLLESKTDAKGSAYEQIVGANLRGDRGEFFTPRNVCDMCVEILFSTYQKEQWSNLKVIDPACGTGGFLVSFINVYATFFEQILRNRYGEREDKIQSEKSDMVREFANKCLTGIDINPSLVSTAQMNLFLHGDGSTNVYCANALKHPGEWPDISSNNLKNNVKLNCFDIVITNPPFGSKTPVDDPYILEQFELAKKSRMSVLPPEQLFIERCMQLLKPGGRMAIVLPDSILSNPGLLFIRKWILENARIIASIDLPTETFEPYTGTQTSVLILQKKTEEERRIEKQSGKMNNYNVFMSVPEAVGHDRRGNPLYLRTKEGEVVERVEEVVSRKREFDDKNKKETQKRTLLEIFDQLPLIVDDFINWVSYREIFEWINDQYNNDEIKTSHIYNNDKLKRDLVEKNILRPPVTLKTSLVNLLNEELRLDAEYYMTEMEQNRSGSIVKDFAEEIFVAPISSRFFAKEGEPYLTPSDLYDIRPISKKNCISRKLKEPEKWFVKKNWLLITQSGTVGKTTLATKYHEKFVISQNLIRVIPKEDTPIGYIYAYLNTKHGQSSLQKDKYGSTVKHLEPYHVAKINLPKIDDDFMSEIDSEIRSIFELREQANLLEEKIISKLETYLKNDKANG